MNLTTLGGGHFTTVSSHFLPTALEASSNSKFLENVARDFGKC